MYCGAFLIFIIIDITLYTPSAGTQDKSNNIGYFSFNIELYTGIFVMSSGHTHYNLI